MVHYSVSTPPHWGMLIERPMEQRLEDHIGVGRWLKLRKNVAVRAHDVCKRIILVERIARRGWR